MQNNNNLINEQRSEKFQTLRPTVEALEQMLYNPIPVLDHGFIRVIDYMGNDDAIVQAARVSYGKGTKQKNDDVGLINYLMRHRHTTPFEMCEIKLHIKLPIFVARQWIRHRTANVNEISARYSILPREFYIPAIEQIAPQSSLNHQGRAESSLTIGESTRILQILRNDAEQCYDHYIEMLNEDEYGNVLDKNNSGVARELARINLTLNSYTEFYWKINLHNLFHFLSLRVDSHAQYEIRVYGEAILDMVKLWVPIAYEAFMEYRMLGAHLSGRALEVVRAMLQGQMPTVVSSGMTKREWAELMKILQYQVII